MLVRRNSAYGLQHVGGTREDDFFEHWCVCHRAIERGNPRHGRVEMLEQFLADP